MYWEMRLRSMSALGQRVGNRTQAAVWAQSHLHCCLTGLAPDSDGKLVAAANSFADASK